MKAEFHVRAANDVDFTSVFTRKAYNDVVASCSALKTFGLFSMRTKLDENHDVLGERRKN